MSHYNSQSYSQHAQALCEVGAFFFQRGWCPATSSNFSAKLDDTHIAITVSGKDKGALQAADIMVVNHAGVAIGSNLKSSAETGLHTQLYAWNMSIGAVLHTHSSYSNAFSMAAQARGESHLRFAGYELIKAFEGHNTHDTHIDLPIFPNNQDIPALATQVNQYLQTNPHTQAYLIAGHGLYTWGKDIASARRHVEAIEALLETEYRYRNLMR